MKVWFVIVHEPYGGGAVSWYLFETQDLAEAFADECSKEYGIDREWVEVEERRVRTSLEGL